MHVLLVVCQLSLSIVLLIAAIGKLAYPRQFIAAIRTSGIPKPLTNMLAILTVIFELELASTLIFSTTWLLLLSFTGAFILLGFFTIWLTSVYRRKLDVQCGCFGASHSSVNKTNILRNLIFMGIAVVGGIAALFTSNVMSFLSIWILAVDVVLAVGTLLFFLKHLHEGHQARPASLGTSGGQGEAVSM